MRTVDTTAAGDAFTGGFLAALLHTGKDISRLNRDEFELAVRTANIVGGLTTTRKGQFVPLRQRKRFKARWTNSGKTVPIK